MLYFLIPFIFFLIVSIYSSCIPSNKQCGCSHQPPVFSEFKIVGGQTARKYSWPWIVSIRQADPHQSLTDPGIAVCGGTLINEKYVLTAAHCFYDMNHLVLSNYFIVVGAHYINDTNPIRFKIKSVKLHEKYDHDLFSYDIALIELSHEVDFNNTTVGFICLPSTSNSSYPYEKMNSFAIGWGRLKENCSGSYTLQQVRLTIISNKNQFCKKEISDNLVHFCAGFIEGGRDTCQGDSGGPLMIYDGNTDTWNIGGITSYGSGCARPETPGVYTRVSVFVDWINKQVSSSSESLKNRMTMKVVLFLFYIILFL